MEIEILTKNFRQTKQVGRALAREIIREGRGEKAAVIALVGDLGGGKTTFTQGLAAGLGVKEKVLSPTFVILKSFNARKNSSPFERLYHIDCYRIGKAKDIAELGFDEIIGKPENIVVVEWADKIKELLPKTSLFILFEFIDSKTRKIKIMLK
ncbi:MAG: tRNA (adenosine(37)-N6)-threonylcarbamoyltransferase complex ATPase subunit type 1 TsaE [Candidatus Nealsonbacteria bacterium]|nr:tRNA (adenosine(37)-N6)-threonylcarbamoyltransferase complex ATPase subunit type 1 TsaE [Candidatus Nealsonbacteria bacterium]